MARLPRAADLTLPDVGSTTVRSLFSEALRAAIRTTQGLGHPTFRADVLPALMRSPGFFAAALRQPSRLTFARCLAMADGPADVRRSWETELAAGLALDAARAGLLPAPVSFAGPRTLVDERRGTWLGPIAGQGPFTIAPSGEVSDARGALPEAPAFVALTDDGAIRLCLHDKNPLSALEAHPDKSGSLVDLGGHDAAEWRAALSSALAVIDRALPAIAGEMRLLLSHVVPVGFDAEKHLSASYLEAAGVVYLTLHPRELTLVEALVHEFQHNKLNLLLGLDRVLENQESELYTSPVRPDPRPLRGVLLAVHAFQPLIVLYDRLIAAAAGDQAAALVTRRDQIVSTCHAGCSVLLPNARPTEAGTPLLEEIAALDRRFADARLG